MVDREKKKKRWREMELMIETVCKVTERELNPETAEPATPAYKLLQVPRNILVERER